MTCHNCRTECRKFGKRGVRRRYQCIRCRKVFYRRRRPDLIQNASARRSWNAPTCRSEWVFAALRGPPTRSPRASRNWAAVVLWYTWYNFRPSASLLAARQQWKLELRTTFGACGNYWRPLDRRIPTMAQTTFKPIDQILAHYAGPSVAPERCVDPRNCWDLTELRAQGG